MRKVLFFLSTFTAPLLFLACSPEEESLGQSTGVRRMAVTAVTPAKKCPTTRHPSTDPKKQTTTKCGTQQQKAPSASFIAAQEEYIRAWKKNQPAWSKLSAAQQEKKRRALKASLLDQDRGGQP